MQFIQLVQRLFPKPETRTPHHLATIDFDGAGIVGKGQIVVTTHRNRLDLPSHHGDINLRDTTMTHWPHCRGRVLYRKNFGWLVCDKCSRLWERPLDAVTLGEIIEHYYDHGFACVWKHSKRVVVGAAVR